MDNRIPHKIRKHVFDLVLTDKGQYVLFKQGVSSKDKKDIPGFLIVKTLSDLFEDRNLLSCLLSGRSTVTNRPFSERMGLKEMTLLTYSLEGLSQSKKTQFGYALRGRKKGEGLLRAFDAKMSGRNAIILPTQKLPFLIEFLNSWAVQYTKETLFRQNVVENKQKEETSK